MMMVYAPTTPPAREVPRLTGHRSAPSSIASGVTDPFVLPTIMLSLVDERFEHA